MFMSYFSCYTDDTDNGLEYVFEGVVKNSIVDHVVPHYDEDSANPRLQLKADTVREEYSKLYDEQLRNIIEGYDLFHGDEARSNRVHSIHQRRLNPRDVLKTNTCPPHLLY
jgi:hypothetical protein